MSKQLTNNSEIINNTTMKQEIGSSKVSESTLGKWARDGKWDMLLENINDIDMHSNIREINFTTFHRWLLTNPDERAFSLWKKTREYAKNNNSYYSYTLNNYFNFWQDSAALLLYANLPERLNVLDEEEWGGSLNYFELANEKINFKFKGDIPEKTKERVIKALKTSGDQGAMDLIFLRGYQQYMIGGNSREKRLPTHSYMITWERRIKNYLTNEEYLPIKPIIEIIKEQKDSDLEVSFFRNSIDHVNAERLKEIWENISLKGQDQIINLFANTGISFDIQNKIFTRDRLDVFEYINSLLISRNKNEMKVSFFGLCEAIKADSVNSVNFLLNKHPEWLEKKLQVYKHKRYKKMGTVLVLSAMYSSKNVFECLLSRGASVDTMKSMLNYEPFKEEQTTNKEFMIYAEQAILRHSISSGKVRLNYEKHIVL